jgi:hypothetical protein
MDLNIKKGKGRRALKETLDIPRSAVLAVALRGEGAAPDWATCRRFAEEKGTPALKKDASVIWIQ